MTKVKLFNIKLNVFILGEKSIEWGSTASQAAVHSSRGILGKIFYQH